MVVAPGGLDLERLQLQDLVKAVPLVATGGLDAEAASEEERTSPSRPGKGPGRSSTRPSHKASPLAPDEELAPRSRSNAAAGATGAGQAGPAGASGPQVDGHLA
jgi:hypothetical protein